MAKISPLNIGAVSESDRLVSVNKTFEMKVMSDGIFWAILPEADLDTIRRFDGLEKHIKQDRANNWCLTGKSVEEIYGRLRPWVDSLLSVEVVTQTLIFYHFSSDCPHTKDKDGNIYKHGGLNPDYDGLPDTPCGWSGTVGQSGGMSDRQAFHVRVLSGVWIETKTTAKGQESSYQYRRPTDQELGPHGVSLLEWPQTLHPNTYRGQRSAHQHVLYTEERAKFFDSVQLTMCKLQARMADFFDGDGIEDRIASGNFLALSGQP